MATEAQRLINISLSKIALSRSQRGGLSLHRNLLVASVLQKARYVFMEETYQLINYSTMGMGPSAEAVEEDHHAAYNGLPHDVPSSSTDGDQEFHQMAAAVVDLPTSHESDSDKENSAPSGGSLAENTVTYLDLDTSEQSREVLVDSKCNSPPSPSVQKCLKRRRGAMVPDWETEEAVSSILPKRQRRCWGDQVAPDSTQPSSPIPLPYLLQDELSELCSGMSEPDDQNSASAMEIDHITSLVSIFSFGGLVCESGSSSLGNQSGGKLTRSVSTPDLCSSQAKDGTAMGVVQRPYLAMTV